ncbi:pyruvate, phosphate dikinase [Lentilitoribacter sp. EG35]|uniref:pyruvate, phosphate dikinase n=1 Tax=Lentilitoribacter sp. EG35 TaxID=3234192 RepID=UPI00345FD8CE
MTVWIEQLGADTENASANSDANLDSLGYAGARLNTLSSSGFPVQSGFIVKADTCRYFLEHHSLPDGFEAELAAAVQKIDAGRSDASDTGKLPLFLTHKVSPKSRIAGIVSPIYHLGMNAQNARKVANVMREIDPEFEEISSSDSRAAGQFRRFLYQFSEFALGITPDVLEDLFDERKNELNLDSEAEFSLEQVITLSGDFRALLSDEHGIEFPDDLYSQLRQAITAALKSWMSPRAVMQRQIQEIDDNEGLALLVRRGVFADFDGRSGQGFLDTRNRKTGVNEIRGKFGWNIVGDQSARTTEFGMSLTEQEIGEKLSLFQDDPELHAKLAKLGRAIELHFERSQRIGFVVQSGECFIGESVDLQLSAIAQLRTSVDLAREGMISKNEAIMRIDATSLEQILHPSIDPEAKRDVIGSGVSASPGAASGEIVFTAEDAISASREGHKVILVRTETSPEDVHGMQRAEGILTIRGGMTSHAAVIARGMGTPCVCGAGNLRLDLANETLLAAGKQLKKGDLITLDGTRGEVLQGEILMQEAVLSDEFRELMEWTDDARRMDVRTNAEAPLDVLAARQFGATGIGLCRTEHMFFEGDRILAMREMILAETEEGRRTALDKLLPMQRSDFIELFEAGNGQPITIRLLDPPLHEFLPKAEEEILHTANAMGVDASVLHRRIEELEEFNPMLGHRGCRLAISHPEITEMQARAIFQAAIEAAKITGSPVVPEIMVPLVALKKELDFVKERINAVAKEVMEEMCAQVHYLVGTMIELPRAVIRADAIAESAEFFSFGTNDLTQMTYGISRDDASPFLRTYRQKAIVDEDPFVSLDMEGVAELIQMAIERGRATKPDLKIGICGEHGGDPASVKFFDQIGLDYVSCSPFRVPIARLAAAQANIEAQMTASSEAE